MQKINTRLTNLKLVNYSEILVAEYQYIVSLSMIICFNYSDCFCWWNFSHCKIFNSIVTLSRGNYRKWENIKSITLASLLQGYQEMFQIW